MNTNQKNPSFKVRREGIKAKLKGEPLKIADK